MKQNLLRLLIGIVISFLLLLFTSLTVNDSIIASIIIGYFFGVCNANYCMLKKMKDKKEEDDEE